MPRIPWIHPVYLALSAGTCLDVLALFECKWVLGQHRCIVHSCTDALLHPTDWLTWSILHDTHTHNAGYALALYAALVEYKAGIEPFYEALCDISAEVTCSKVWHTVRMHMTYNDALYILHIIYNTLYTTHYTLHTTHYTLHIQRRCSCRSTEEFGQPSESYPKVSYHPKVYIYVSKTQL
jgi:hypothetical protein